MACYRFDIVARRISREELADSASAAHTGLTEDRLFLKDGVSVKALGDGSVGAATWRSKAFSYAWPEGFGWGQVNGQLSAGVVLRLYIDGTLVYTTPTITTNKPFRLPPVKGYRAEVEIQSTARVTGVALSNNSAELL